MAVLTLPLFGGILIAGRGLLHIFGEEFVAGYPALIYMSGAQCLFSFFGPANTILMMQDRERQSAFCLLAYVLVLAIACRLLIPGGGVTGGAIAMLLSSAFYNVLLAVVLRRSTGIGSPFLRWLFRRR
jgi:O-antigen/teichoic acid export membrane protein